MQLEQRRTSYAPSRRLIGCPIVQLQTQHSQSERVQRYCLLPGSRTDPQDVDQIHILLAPWSLNNSARPQMELGHRPDHPAFFAYQWQIGHALLIDIVCCLLLVSQGLLLLES